MEQWKDIFGYNGRYQVSNYGNVKNTKSEKLIAITKTSDGYSKVALHINGEARTFLLHRLVASSFIGDVHGMQVNHMDEDKANNAVCNLEICTASQNAGYGSRMQRIAEKRSIPVIQLSRDGIVLNRFYGSREAGRKTGVTHQRIWGCCAGTYKSAGGYLWMFEEQYNISNKQMQN